MIAIEVITIIISAKRKVNENFSILLTKHRGVTIRKQNSAIFS